MSRLCILLYLEMDFDGKKVYWKKETWFRVGLLGTTWFAFGGDCRT